MQTIIPEQIGDFEILDQIGRGGMGVVYLALQPSLDRLVAVKVMQVDDAELAIRLQLEARTLADIQHPHIVRVLDVGDDGGSPFYAMELCAGGSVAHVLERDGRLSPGRTAHVLAAVAEALGAMHGRGLVHRDVKPSNVLLSIDGEPYLSDFGLAVDARWSRMTGSGAIVATIGYAAPELLGGEDVAPAADVFSLGVMGYQLLTGELPFTGAHIFGIIDAVRTGTFPPLAARVPDAGAELVELIVSCLNADAAARPADLGVLAEALRASSRVERVRPARRLADIQPALIAGGDGDRSPTERRLLAGGGGSHRPLAALPLRSDVAAGPGDLSALQDAIDASSERRRRRPHQVGDTGRTLAVGRRGGGAPSTTDAGKPRRRLRPLVVASLIVLVLVAVVGAALADSGLAGITAAGRVPPEGGLPGAPAELATPLEAGLAGLAARRTWRAEAGAVANLIEVTNTSDKPVTSYHAEVVPKRIAPPEAVSFDPTPTATDQDTAGNLIARWDLTLNPGEVQTVRYRATSPGLLSAAELGALEAERAAIYQGLLAFIIRANGDPAAAAAPDFSSFTPPIVPAGVVPAAPAVAPREDPAAPPGHPSVPTTAAGGPGPLATTTTLPNAERPRPPAQPAPPAPVPSPAAIRSSFDHDAEGWTTVGSSTMEHRGSGGAPGGFVSGTDVATSEQDKTRWDWEAPAKFKGDQSAFLGRSLAFDLKQVSSLPPFEYDALVWLYGWNGAVLVYDRRTEPKDWTHYAVPLDGTGWRTSGRAATREDMLAALRNVKYLRIRGEFWSGIDTGGLDNVVLGA